MLTVLNSDQARSRLDARLALFPSSEDSARPHKGWIRAIRNALGMSASDLATRMGVRQQTISDIERSERHDTIQLKTLERAAHAMDCRLVYALVPNSTLDETVSTQARRKAMQYLEAISHHSQLEDQPVSDEDLAVQVSELAERMADRRELWSDSVPSP